MRFLAVLLACVGLAGCSMVEVRQASPVTYRKGWCPNCGNTGKVSCDICWGGKTLGGLVCYKCGGRGKVTCPDCNGKNREEQ